MCVCVRERERGREREYQRMPDCKQTFYLHVIKLPSTSVLEY